MTGEYTFNLQNIYGACHETSLKLDKIIKLLEKILEQQENKEGVDSR